ncbi:MAG: HAMP domain-containing protein [Ignavibacteriales bacterium]|nr:MAG: HAMP domain-containing protein [Ignavibacteriales bacterium]
MFGKYFKSRKKIYFSGFLLLLLSIIVLAIVAPILQEHKKNNWENELKKNIAEIENGVLTKLDKQQKDLLLVAARIKNQVRKSLGNNDEQGNVLKLLAANNNKDYLAEVINKNEKLIGWTNKVPIPQEDFFPLNFRLGEAFFYRSSLVTYLTVIDTLSAGNSFYLAVGVPIEKHFEIDNEYSRNISLTKDLTQKYLTEVEFNYSPFAKKTRDGRKFSIEILNNKEKKIGVITLSKPSLDSRLLALNEEISKVQSVLAFAALFFLMLGFYSDIKRIKRKWLQFVFYTVLLAGLRYAMFWLDIPSVLIESPVTDASFFASTFGMGIVKSPIELLITVIFLLVFSFSFFKITFSSLTVRQHNVQADKKKFALLFIILIPLLLIMLRGLGAAIKSVIFDSSLRYFKEPGLLPNLPIGLMELNVLLLGFSCVIVSIAFILIIVEYFPIKKPEGRTIVGIFFILFILLQLLGWLYDLMQADPQGNDLIRIIYLTLIIALSFKIYFQRVDNTYNYAYVVLTASIVTIGLMNYYNSKLENESLKTTAYELTRTSSTWLEFLVTQSLMNAENIDETYRALKDRLTNYESAAFIIWSGSQLQKEKLNSSVALLDRQKNLLGSFGIELDEKYRVNPRILQTEIEGLKIFDNYYPAQLEGKITSGVIPIRDSDVLLGYVVVSILYDETNYGRIDYPGFISPEFNMLNSTVDFETLKIFEYRNNKLENVYGDITPSFEITKKIISARFVNNEAWISLNHSGDDYSAYVLKFAEKDDNRILAVALKEKKFSWSLYNFLKVFFVHILFLTVYLIIGFAIQLYRAKIIKLTFRIQLLTAFLFISLFPLIFLAVYNRSLTDQKNIEATKNTLKEKTINLEKYFKNNLNKNENQQQLFRNATDQLDINFTIYKNEKLYFSSRQEFNLSGLLPDIINPNVYSKFESLGFTEELEEDSFEDYKFNSFYKKITVGSYDYIIQVADVFNKVSLPITGEEFDVFLFGSYSIAIILIIILSAFLANRISSPIRKLTRATESVAEGDLSIEVEEFQKGEVGDLVKGFNLMIQQLKKSQTELAELERENAWKEMARQVAHEIKNPLTPMKLAVQQLVIAYKDRSVKFDSIFDKVSNTIINQIDTLSNIASEFSSFTRMPKPKLEVINLISSIEEVRNLFIDEKVKIELDSVNNEITVEADKDHLKRTFINLIRNSIQAKATAVNLKVESEGKEVSIRIIDNGKGIPEEFISRIFEPNFTTKEKGMGIGLKLAKKFLESINAGIRVEYSNEKGTCILVTMHRLV